MLPGRTLADKLRNSPEALICLPALAEYDRLNSDAGQIIPGRGERLDDYFTLLIEPHDDRTCSLVLNPKIQANHWRPYPRGTPDNDEKDIIRWMRDRLDALAINPDLPDAYRSQVQVSAFSYGMSPRLRRAYSVQTASNSSASWGWLGSKLGLSDNSTFAGDMSDPEIVGYVPPAPDTAGVSALAARFGWVVGPERNGPAPWQRRLSIQQAQLGALVAIPSWWRTVLMRTCTGFVRESELPQLTQKPQYESSTTPKRHGNSAVISPIAGPLKDCRIDILRLPGTAQDVSRRLGVEVVKFPFLKSPENQPDDTTLIAGRAGRLLLEGGRLWRSSVVMLGAQKADRIEVLPDMQGLTAYFDCVEIPLVQTRKVPPPATQSSPEEAALQQIDHTAAGDLELAEVPVRVWTSEGSTQLSYNVHVLVAKQPKLGDLCRNERPPPLPSTKEVPPKTPTGDKGAS